ncbi:MAG: tRNA lysidine(34) synthetase TilS [Rhodobacteraceae bacterium]|nr:tRNA lysidine(34) synthetase TilS [Paracoccaceae bacterium]
MEAALARYCDGPAPLAVAVSGGGDSVTLLLALAARAAQGGAVPHAVTVDHGLRPAAADEAAFVAALCDRLGVTHATLQWRGWDRRGNLQDAARRARQGLIADWARAQGIDRVALGHTRDDQAETVLMRLGRGAGVDGLSAMAPMRSAQGVMWLRPLLDIPRADLRSYLRARGQDWIEDPSNEDSRYARVQARAALSLLDPLGVTTRGLAETARRLASARAALAACTAETAARIVTVDRGDVLVSRAGLAAAPDEIARRLVNAALCWVSSAQYPPRAEALAETLTALSRARRATLHGCLITREAGRLRIAREYAAVAETVGPIDRPWDGRWIVSGPATGHEELRALGEAGLAGCPDWRGTGLVRSSLLASPAVWRGTRLIAAPLAALDNGWQAKPCVAFTSRILSH